MTLNLITVVYEVIDEYKSNLKLCSRTVMARRCGAGAYSARHF